MCEGGERCMKVDGYIISEIERLKSVMMKETNVNIQKSIEKEINELYNDLKLGKDSDYNEEG